jgi:hypothetical protein
LDGAGAAHTLCETTSTGGKALTLDFAGARVARDTQAALLCPTPASPVKLAQLWMPDMGHGSAETTLTAVANGCTQVDNIQFTMAGPWQLRVRFADGDRALAEFAVE